jgi:predicted nuclease of predicted toxin-antitoxin system
VLGGIKGAYDQPVNAPGSLLSGEGFESIHVGDVDLLTATDQATLDCAAANGLVIISADPDFGELLALSRGAVRPLGSLAPVRGSPHP